MQTTKIRPLTKRDKDHIASVAAGELRRLAGDTSVSEEGLRTAAERLRVAIETITSAASGKYSHPFQPDLPATIFLPNCSPRKRNRMLVHEITHHLLHHFVPQALFNAELVFCHEQDGDGTRHEIAQRAEELYFGDNAV
jgi:hypothetical protein